VIRFSVVGRASAADRDVVYLSSSSWDDWFKFETLFNVAYIDANGKQHDIGGTKIGSFGLRPAGRETEHRPGYRRPDPPAQFTRLGEEFFSLGQDTSYYERLTRVSPAFREEFLDAMRDLAYVPGLLERAKAEEVTRVSLLREVPLATVGDQFARLARGGERLTEYNFGFRYRYNRNSDPVDIAFAVKPNSKPPSNIHVIIGRNGVGKSTLLNAFAQAVVLGPPGEGGKSRSGPQDQISNVVSVSFSAFDAFEPISVPHDRTKGVTYHYVGLKKVGAKNDEAAAPKNPAALSREMTFSAQVCLVGARKPRLQRALRLLESDPIFAGVGLADLLYEAENDQEILEELPRIFRLLSSGHKIVLLTVTKLVETVEEKSLVLLDEPEAHLHPPLLSAFVRALSDLLTNRNGMAIVATHSPVVLQEVPRSCVLKLQRSGNVLEAGPPKIETFGENVGTLTDEIFGLEVTATGFHKMLADVAAHAGSYEEALAEFHGQLGAEGRAILRAMIRSGTAHVGY
jgi:predicted ATPase